MTDLDRLGARHKKLRAELEDLTPKLHEAMREERATGATQNDIRERSGYKTIQQVRVILGEVKTAQEDLDAADPALVAQMERTATDSSSRTGRGRPTRK